MKCSDARFALAANPDDGARSLRQHVESCVECAAYAADMHELNRRILSALQAPVPTQKPCAPDAITAPPQAVMRRRYYTRRFALAASMAGVAVLAGLLWIGVPRASLADAVVAHMAGEPGAWNTSVALPEAAVATVLFKAGINIKPQMPAVTYAQSCEFRGHSVPHLVVRTASGPVTIMVLPHEPVSARTAFDEGGYRGVLVPAERGSIAVLARDGTSVDVVAAQALAAIRYVQ